MAWALRSSRTKAERAVSGDMAVLPVEGALQTPSARFPFRTELKQRAARCGFILWVGRRPDALLIESGHRPPREGNRAMRGVTPALSACRRPLASPASRRVASLLRHRSDRPKSNLCREWS